MSERHISPSAGWRMRHWRYRLIPPDQPTNQKIAKIIEEKAKQTEQDHQPTKSDKYRTDQSIAERDQDGLGGVALLSIGVLFDTHASRELEQV